MKWSPTPLETSTNEHLLPSLVEEFAYPYGLAQDTVPTFKSRPAFSSRLKELATAAAQLYTRTVMTDKYYGVALIMLRSSTISGVITLAPRTSKECERCERHLLSILKNSSSWTNMFYSPSYHGLLKSLTIAIRQVTKEDGSFLIIFYVPNARVTPVLPLLELA